MLIKKECNRRRIHALLNTRLKRNLGENKIGRKENREKCYLLQGKTFATSNEVNFFH